MTTSIENLVWYLSKNAACYEAFSRHMNSTAMDVALLVAVLLALCRAAAQPPAEILQALEAAQQAQHQVVVAYGPPNITAANVRRIANASQPAEGSAAGGGSSTDDKSALGRSSNTAPLSGVEQAMAEGVPVNLHLLMQNPAAAAQVHHACITSG